MNEENKGEIVTDVSLEEFYEDAKRSFLNMVSRPIDQSVLQGIPDTQAPDMGEEKPEMMSAEELAERAMTLAERTL